MNTISYNEALETLKTMFPTIDISVIESVLVSFRGMMERTIDTLLVMQNESAPPPPQGATVVAVPPTPTPPTAQPESSPIQNSPSPTSPLSELNLGELLQDLPTIDSSSIPATVPPGKPAPTGRPEMTDEEYARQLQKQIEHEDRQRAIQEQKDAEIARNLQHRNIPPQPAANNSYMSSGYYPGNPYPIHQPPSRNRRSSNNRSPTPTRQPERRDSRPRTPARESRTAENSTDESGPGLISKFKSFKNRFKSRADYATLDDDNDIPPSSIGTDVSESNGEDPLDLSVPEGDFADAIPLRDMSTNDQMDNPENLFMLDSDEEEVSEREVATNSHRRSSPAPFNFPPPTNHNSNKPPSHPPSSSPSSDSPIVDPFQAIAESLA